VVEADDVEKLSDKLNKIELNEIEYVVNGSFQIKIKSVFKTATKKLWPSRRSIRSL
jgi:hypothetical protein